jgi:transcriptional regulator with XRE-family HTH domain
MINQQEKQRYRELGDFLRTRRARLSPEQVGISSGGKRRTLGLRRVEVAQLAGISVDWYTWLEQGRPITVSTQVLESLVQALRLDADERKHLFFLAHQQVPPAPSTACEAISPALQHFLDHLGICPAYVVGRRWDVVAWNEAACAVFGDFRLMTGRERNAIRRVFTSQTHRQLLANWEGHARRLLAQFRVSYSRSLGDPQLTELINDLMVASPEFRAWWPQHDVLETPAGQKVICHPRVGFLRLEYLTFQVHEACGLKVTTYTPLDGTETAQRLHQLLNEKSRVPIGF